MVRIKHLSCPYTGLQVDHIGDLSVAVGGSNWELFTGNVRKIEVSAKEAVYKVPPQYCYISPCVD